MPGDILDVADILMKYVATTGYYKMHLRMAKGTSRAILKRLTDKKIPNHIDEYDKEFGKADEHDEVFLRYMVDRMDLFEPYSDLFALAKEMAAALKESRPDAAEYLLYKNFALYTKSTQKQFHELFTDCLTRFRYTLQVLAFNSSTDNERERYFRNFKIGDAKHKNNYYIREVKRHGITLQKLIQTSAIQSHLKFITELPWDLSGAQANPEPVLGYLDDEANAEMQGEDIAYSRLDEDTDSEPLVEAASSNVTPVVKPYRDWLRLIVADFEAADTLIDAVFKLRDNSSSPITATIKIVRPVSVDSAALEWDQLFGAGDKFFSDSSTSFKNADILQFLKNVESAHPRAQAFLDELKNVVKASKALSLDKAKNILGFISNHEDIKPYLSTQQEIGDNFSDAINRMSQKRWLQDGSPMSVLPDWHTHLLAILSQLTTFEQSCHPIEKDMTKSRIAQEGAVKCINDNFALLQESLKFYGELIATNDKHFKGRIHCEAALACLMCDSGREVINDDVNYKDALDALKVSNMKPSIGNCL